MNQLYIISETDNQDLLLDPNFCNNYHKKIHIINYSDQKHDIPLTNEIYKHLNTLTHLSLEKFNWLYYSSKYGHNISRTRSKQSSWDHWSRVGRNENKNPIDRRTIFNSYEINLLMVIISILTHAIKYGYDKIFILNTMNKMVKFANFDLVMNDYNEVIKDKEICIFSYMQINYAYIIDKSIFQALLCEASYFINRFDDILKIFMNTNNEGCQIFNHSNNSAYTYHNAPISVSGHNQLVIDINHITKTIMNTRQQYFMSEYNRFLESEKLSHTQLACIKHIICKLPYEELRTTHNASSNLSFYNYLKLCANLTNQCFWRFINFKSLESDTLPDYSTIYFDHDFYLRLYPSYKKALKNMTESYNHYINRGQIERLLGNEVLFQLAKLSQDYYLQKYLTDFNYQVKSDTSISVVPYEIDTTPIIYVLTRTANREKLFEDCCESIRRQLQANIRHIVSYDNEQTYRYVKDYSHIYKLVDLTAKKTKIHPNQYVDCLYEQLENAEPGWILVLDDDDKLMTPFALSYLMKYMNNPNNMMIWMLYRPDKFVYPADKNNPVVGEIGSCCYMYHTSKIKIGVWEGSAIGDFNFFKYVFDNTKDHVYIDYPLTGINYSEKISGWSAM